MQALDFPDEMNSRPLSDHKDGEFSPHGGEVELKTGDTGKIFYRRGRGADGQFYGEVTLDGQVVFTPIFPRDSIAKGWLDEISHHYRLAEYSTQSLDYSGLSVNEVIKLEEQTYRISNDLIPVISIPLQQHAFIHAALGADITYLGEAEVAVAEETFKGRNKSQTQLLKQIRDTIANRNRFTVGESREAEEVFQILRRLRVSDPQLDEQGCMNVLEISRELEKKLRQAFSLNAKQTFYDIPIGILLEASFEPFSVRTKMATIRERFLR